MKKTVKRSKEKGAIISFVAKLHSQAALTVKYVGVGQGMTVSLVSKLNVINALHIIPKLF